MAKRKTTFSGLHSTARRLREARRACAIFLDLWALTRLRDPRSLDRVAADLSGDGLQPPGDQLGNDWSYLYRGSILDD